MRRQLYRGGGIASIPRQNFGIGSWVKERVRKLIPNEIADVAAKAAPFVAPFNPIAAGLMRGIGRFDKRGSLSDALKQGLLTYGAGQAARHLGGAGMQTGYSPMGGMGQAGTSAWASPFGTETGFGAWGAGADAPSITAARTAGTSGAPGGGAVGMHYNAPPTQGPLSKFFLGEKGGTGMFGEKGLIGAGGEFGLKESFGKGLPAVYAGSTLAALAVQKAMGDVGDRESGESLEAFNTRRKGTVGKYLDFYFRRANKFRIAPENMDKAAADFVAQNTQEYVSQGGRIGYQTGGTTGLIGKGVPWMPSAWGDPGTYRRSVWNLASDVNPYDVESTADLESYLASAPRFTDEIMKANPNYASSWRGQPIDPREYYLKELALKKQTHLPSAYPNYSPDMYRDMVKDLETRYNEAAYSHAAEMGGGTQPTYTVPLTGTSAPKYDRATINALMNKQMAASAPTTTPAGIPAAGISMGNTLAQNVAANNAQRLANQAVLQTGRARINPSTGGRIGLRFGGNGTPLPEDPTKPINPWTPKPKEGIKSLEAGAPEITYEGDMTPPENMQMASAEDPILMEEYNKYVFEMEEQGIQPMSFEQFKAQARAGQAQGGRIGFDKGTMNPALMRRMMELMMQGVPRHKLKEEAEKQLRQEPYINERMGMGPGPILEAAQGGRIGYAFGAQAGLPGIPRMAPDGMEYDMSQNGGFQPLGAKEGKDDVKANLAKNEFVFTADAVRGAGNGDIELGAQKMYDTMKNLERRVV